MPSVNFRGALDDLTEHVFPGSIPPDFYIRQVVEFVEKSEDIQPITPDMIDRMRAVVDTLTDSEKLKLVTRLRSIAYAPSMLGSVSHAQQRRLALAFSSVIDPPFIFKDERKVRLPGFSPEEMALIYGYSEPGKLLPRILAEKFATHTLDTDPSAFSFIFDPNSEALKNITDQERQELAQRFVIHVGKLLKERGAEGDSPAQSLAILFGDDLLNEPEFNAEIIEGLLKYMEHDVFIALANRPASLVESEGTYTGVTRDIIKGNLDVYTGR